MVSTKIRNLLTSCQVHGNGDAQVCLSLGEMAALFELVCSDFGIDLGDAGLSATGLPSNDYYSIPLSWFDSREKDRVSTLTLLTALDFFIRRDQDLELYVSNLCALHRRRVKYRRILASQQQPSLEQIAPRGLLEFGQADNGLLCNWMIWRKWIYDVDNRVAQEAGYLFEPILASCLGGESVGAKNSPVKRLNAKGEPTNKGRQIDCYIADKGYAFELKLRVTIAASGQGRFGEELSFPYEAAAAGLTPILLVLDPTPSARLTDLSEAYKKAGGRSYIGDAAWEAMEEEAGDIMSNFINEYIKPPLMSLDECEPETPTDITLSWSDERIVISGDGEQYEIVRG